MKFNEKFNEVCKFSDPNFEDLPDLEKEYYKKVKSFHEQYDVFKKEHGLENMYFSTIKYVSCKDHMLTEVWYSISDLYLTYLEANDILPRGIYAERYLIKEQYLYNTEKEWLFSDSMFSAANTQRNCEERNGCTVISSSMFEGITERIKLSNPSNGLPGMIVERIPMTYDDLKNLNFK